MYYLLSVLAGSTVITGFLALAFAYLRTFSLVDGKYNRARFLPSEIDGRLRRNRSTYTIGWVIISILFTALGILLHWIYVDSIKLDGGFWFQVLYASQSDIAHLYDGELPEKVGFPLIYSVFLVLLVVASVFCVRFGVRFAAKRFILTRALPAVS